MNQTEVLIAYRRSWKRTLLGSLVVATLALLMMVWMWPAIKSGLYSEGIRFKVGAVILGSIPGGNLVLYLWHAVNAGYYQRDVTVTLDATALTCSIPGDLMSQSFSVAIDETTEINKMDSDSGPEAFRIQTHSATFNLFGNYGIPSRRIVNEITRVRPSIVVGIA